MWSLRPSHGFVYNSVAFGDWLFFLRGPYSAKAIEVRTATARLSAASRLAQPWVVLIFFVKAAEMDAAAGSGATLLLLIAVAGHLIAWLANRRRGIRVGAAALAAGSLLCVLGRLRFGADLSSGLVAALLVQPALRNGVAAGLCAGLGFAAHLCLGAVREFKRYGRRANWENATALLLFALLAAQCG